MCEPEAFKGDSSVISGKNTPSFGNMRAHYLVWLENSCCRMCVYWKDYVRRSVKPFTNICGDRKLLKYYIHSIIKDNKWICEKRTTQIIWSDRIFSLTPTRCHIIYSLILITTVTDIVWASTYLTITLEIQTCSQRWKRNILKLLSRCKYKVSWWKIY